MPVHPGVTPEWIDDQISGFKSVRRQYTQYAKALKAELERAADELVPLAIVTARAKTIESFAEKAGRKYAKYRDPVERMTDLCGARVIVPTRRGVEAICRFVEDHFEIDRENSVAIAQRLKPTEFGYRSVHYVVSPKKGSRLADVSVRKGFAGKKAEVQVRTILEHGWSEFTHDRSYKGAFAVPDRWERKLRAIAADLELTDDQFMDIEEGLKTYAATYGQYLMKDQLEHEMSVLQCIFDHDRRNAALRARLGKLAIAAGDWRKAVSVLKRAAADDPNVLRDLGIAMCKLHKPGALKKQKRHLAGYRRGQSHLEEAIRLAPDDVDAIANLAGTWREFDAEKAARLYCQAFEIDPTDPFALCNHLECQITCAGNVSLIGAIRPTIRASIQRCNEQAAVGVNIPWAHYSRGLFHLLLGDPYRSLAAYAKAIEKSSAPWMMCTSLSTLDRLTPVTKGLRGIEWMRQLLMLGPVALFPRSDDAAQVRPSLVPTPEERRQPPAPEHIAAPVIILAGGCDASTDEEMKGRYQSLLVDAFKGFEGTLIGGGTTAGISGIVGDIQQQYPDSIITIGYVPDAVPKGVTIDSRYRQIRQTKGKAFTPVESLQSWTDLIASGVPPYDVRVLMVNGGEVTAADCRIALSLGASVGVIEESGGEAMRLLADPKPGRSPRLVGLPLEAAQVNAFILRGAPMLAAEIRETIAKAVHNLYRKNQAQRKPPDDPSMADWEHLREDLRESNRQQADHFVELLRRIGCGVERVTDRPIVLMDFTAGEIELMAELEHERWNRERHRDDWQYGPERDVAKKISPYLLPWSELPDEIREYDRETVRGIPELLAGVGLEVGRIT